MDTYVPHPVWKGGGVKSLGAEGKKSGVGEKVKGDWSGVEGIREGVWVIV